MSNESASALKSLLVQWAKPQVLLVGVATGVISALAGVGGGIILVPGLMAAGNLKLREAVATSLGAIFMLSAIATAMHLVIADFELSIGGSAALLASGFAGAQIGGAILNLTPPRMVMTLFSGLTFFTALQMMGVSLGWIPAIVQANVQPPFWAYPAIGIPAGVFSGLLGIGGGGLVILGFSLMFHTPVAAGLPLALMVNTVNALSGIFAQWRTKQIHWFQVARLVPAAVVGIAAGTVGAAVMPPDVLRIVFALVFLFMGAAFLRRSMTNPPDRL